MGGNLNTGHGHVRLRPDGYRARCGGPPFCSVCLLEMQNSDPIVTTTFVDCYATSGTPPALTFPLGARVRKKSGSKWQGTVCGWYSTKLTPDGYAVESEVHAGSVQIYPAAALELVPEETTNEA